MTDAETRQQWIDGLRELATFVEERPELPLPESKGVSLFLLPQGHTLETIKVDYDRIAKEVGVFVEKRYKGAWIVSVRKFGPHEITLNERHQQVYERLDAKVPVPA